MVDHVLNRLLALFARKHVHIVGARILLLGITFKENCSDIRNSQVVRLVQGLQKMNADIVLVDPYVDIDACVQSTGIQPLREIPEDQPFDAAVLAVAHQQFSVLNGERIRELVPEPGVVFDVKNQLPKASVDGAL